MTGAVESYGVPSRQLPPCAVTFGGIRISQVLAMPELALYFRSAAESSSSFRKSATESVVAAQ